MKRLVSIFMLFVLLTLPLTAWAWPTALHDDGGPYRQLALASFNHYLATGVLTPWSIELSILNEEGTRLAWISFDLPDHLRNLPEQDLTLQVLTSRYGNYTLYLSLTTTENDLITSSVLFSADFFPNNDEQIIVNQHLTSLPIPANTRDLAITLNEQQIYLLWKTTDEDNISSILINRLNWPVSTRNSLR